MVIFQFSFLDCLECIKEAQVRHVVSLGWVGWSSLHAGMMLPLLCACWPFGVWMPCHTGALTGQLTCWCDISCKQLVNCSGDTPSSGGLPIAKFLT